ncbi:di-trans,poly-cis-decaprenylcistransferase [Actinomyces sp. 432]|uniref:polyprenyl diphosphate synthase n=1 Tax=Actinomyces sp. 432 TaxID=2057798 RepID=UPI00137442B5|nr:polyprenyl diphosphate synthase [Actinomyces sp. 432]QHO91125.1 di-trans,poly-cis-decaprenylcistransferase [Actinomyces sp. 432]
MPDATDAAPAVGGGSDPRPLDVVPLHRQGLTPPALDPASVPAHVACVMDGNGRWANARGLPRTEGHRVGESTMMDVIAGAVELGVKELSVYAFSTENWKRSPAEVRFLMGFTRTVLRAQTDDLLAWGVRVNWVGREPKLWKSVLKEVRRSERITAGNDTMVLNMCLNYGGRAELADAARAMARDVEAGRLRAASINEKTVQRYLYSPHMRDVDLLIRTGGEQRTSNFLMWSSAYAELYFSDLPWPEFDRTELWRACEAYAHRERRFGGAVERVAGA